MDQLAVLHQWACFFYLLLGAGFVAVVVVSWLSVKEHEEEGGGGDLIEILDDVCAGRCGFIYNCVVFIIWQ